MKRAIKVTVDITEDSQYAVITIYKVVFTCKVSTSIFLKTPMIKYVPFLK